MAWARRELGAGTVSSLSGLLVLLWSPPPSLAARDAGEECTYAACALRVEPGGFFSGSTLVRGTAGIEVAGVDRSAKLEAHFRKDDPADAHDARFAESVRRWDWLGRLGGALALAGIGVLIGAREHDAWIVGLLAGGFVVSLASTVPQTRARRAFSNAVWWYNRSLVTEDPR